MTLKSLKPFVYKEAEILILGTMTPKEGRDSKLSKLNFYYTSYNQNTGKLINKLYEILDYVYEKEKPSFQQSAIDLRNENNKQDKRKKAMLNLKKSLENHEIAFFDLIESCDTDGHATDSSLSNINVMDNKKLKKIISSMPKLRLILVNSRCVESLLAKIIVDETDNIILNNLKISPISINRQEELKRMLKIPYKYVPSPSNAYRKNLDWKKEQWKLAMKLK